ncbi:MFS transporter [Saccharothrix algeriensis]|uniref:MFS family permease n=1 Tax=Saccharothrix algeriensis TaxID=173560 RepID=A0A8T8HWD3_9PSEU|nr:MFS transporter [Saccharothrix algeriensis]MBM7814525.1 MFS family permease [Saccharothrix algeriensis]QTR02822.1 MFS transporter [Saccharothrix algeriensis]
MTTPDRVDRRPGVPPSAGWGLLLVLAANMLIDAIEVSALVVAAPPAAAGVGLAPAAAHWPVTGFALGFGGLLLAGGRAVALLGRRRVYLGALVVFAAASVVAGLAGDPVTLVAARVVKGACAALTAPTGLAIIGAAFPAGPARDRAVSVYALCGGAGFAAGLLLSGALSTVDWRWALAAPAPVVLVLAVAGARLIPADEPADGRSDLPGSLLLAGALTALAVGVGSALPLPWSPAAAVLAAGFVAAFVVVERRAAHPLVPLAVLRDRALARAAVTAAAMNGVNVGLLLLLSLRWQGGGWSPLTTALALLPASLPLAAAAPFSGGLVRRVGARRLIAVGALAPAAGCALLLRPGAAADYPFGVLPALLLVAAGFVLAFAPLNATALAGAGAAERAAAGGTYQTAVQSGAVVVPALVVTAGDAAVAVLTAVAAVGAAAGLAGLLPRR